MSNRSAGRQNTATTGTHMRESSTSSKEDIVPDYRPTEPDYRPTSDPIWLALQTPPFQTTKNPNNNKHKQPSQKPPSSTPHFYSPNKTTKQFFVLEEIHSTGNNNKILRPATIRAVFSSKAAAHEAMDDFIYACGDPAAARSVASQDVFREGQLLGEGYEFHTRRMRLRTLWIQEGVQEEDLELDEEDGESDEDEESDGDEDDENGGKQGDDDVEAPTVLIQGDGARLSGGGWSLPAMGED